MHSLIATTHQLSHHSMTPSLTTSLQQCIYISQMSDNMPLIQQINIQSCMHGVQPEMAIGTVAHRVPSVSPYCAGALPDALLLTSPTTCWFSACHGMCSNSSAPMLMLHRTTVRCFMRQPREPSAALASHTPAPAYIPVPTSWPSLIQCETLWQLRVHASVRPCADP
jgi:hypothetical protein